MDKHDQSAIEALFGKLAEVERQAPPRDPGSETFIRARIESQPGAPYFMAQTIIVQDLALKAAQERIAELEAKASRSSTGDARTSTSGIPSVGPRAAGRADRTGSGGGFLAGAAQTAMGVAGGLFLGSALAGLFGAGDAAAAGPEEVAGDVPADDAGVDEGGGDFGDMEF